VYTEDQELRPRLTLVFPLLKNGRSEWILQKGTELGVDRFLPFLFERTVVRADWKQKAARYTRVIHEACKQSEQGQEPELAAPCADVAALGALLGDTPGLRIVCWELEKRVRLKELLQGERPAPPEVIVAIGPEGGIPAGELEAFRQASFLSAGLGRQILRSETACLAAAAAIRYEFA
jgi:16S rRNA (uracil1498-N3)-methyltransferase